MFAESWRANDGDGDWPGLAPAAQPSIDPDELADDVTARAGGEVRLGLVATRRGADALAAMGWGGPANYVNDVAKVSAVVRSWEDRFGARVIYLGDHSTLILTVAAPPTDIATAELVAAEHFAFCPDNYWQGAPDETVAGYAMKLLSERIWRFWWD
ncbi:DUF4253 domain-containing protein [Kibdelosporangium philippinense]|uniref:DUF4253 domain-containing protein n=1 Tax=Kibdelosporangium philippinense TaxID=211113 RepID=A0ABS8ZED7_9PSEU|nr:DUF4253 domain-containing protein [Kibdelosporangium philippinense]MCE7006166.1 DUF4253 domain-containing protein [Kibdelosporangium philippinense]